MADNFYQKELRQRTYQRTVLLIMLRAFDEVIGEENIERLMAEFTLSSNVYIRADIKGGLDKKKIAAIWSNMHDCISADLPIEKLTRRVRDAYNDALDRGRDKEALFLHFRRVSRINYTGVDGFYTYFYGPLLRHTGEVHAFDLMPYDKGLFLLLPDVDEPDVIEHFDVPENLFRAYDDAYRNAHLLGVENVSQVNLDICSDRTTELVLTAESIFESRLALTAQDIVRQGKKFVFLAGPSSSGKTSTANRLSYALRNYSIKPRIISLDDFYRDRTEMLANGEKIDIESIEALDLELFAEDMNRLLEGETVELPEFDFITSKRLFKGNRINLGDKDVLIIEGIHSLNPRFTESVPGEYVYKVYVSALSQLNIDDNNRINSSDIRLLRRVTRDHRTRGYNAANTLAVWPDVRRGEVSNIFPYQSTADAIINTSMVYELSAIKPYAERVLFSVPRECAEYVKARELLKFLDFVIPISDDQIPSDSIIREFIGGSALNVR